MRRRAARQPRLGAPPQAPWAPVPLTEITILIAIVALAIAATRGLAHNTGLLVFGLLCMTIATGELSVREHLAGYRSHSAILAALGTAAVTTPLIVWGPGVPKVLVIAVAAVLFFGGLQLLRGVFRRRSGGAAWRS